jgi:putative PIN family toxin of toxin-antitoxin system
LLLAEAHLRVVVDTSSLIRAALNAGLVASQLIETLTSAGGTSQLVASADILDELARVRDRPKFASRLSDQQRRRLLLDAQAAAFFVSPAERIGACRDPADNIILEAALAAMEPAVQVVVIVSDDRDLLPLDPWHGIRVAKPEAVLVTLGASEAGRDRGGPR